MQQGLGGCEVTFEVCCKIIARLVTKLSHRLQDHQFVFSVPRLLVCSRKLSILTQSKLGITMDAEGTSSAELFVAETPPGAVPVSRNQQKRLIKEEHRRLSKLRKKEESKKRKREEKSVAEPQDDDDDVVDNHTPALSEEGKVVYPPHDAAAKKERKQKEAEEFAAKCASNFSVILDCAWEDKHNESTMKSLTQQIMFCYGINRKHECPAAMYMTGVGPQVTTNLNKSNFSNWQGVTITSEEYIAHPHFSLEPQPAQNSDGSTNNIKQLVYLTSDAEETLETLDPRCAYIIGGIVDRNRHKFATFNKANAQNVRVAKLPIKENFALAATHILTVNHVYNILLNYAKYQDWVQAIKEVMPSRKGPVEKGGAEKEGEEDAGADNVDVAADADYKE